MSRYTSNNCRNCHFAEWARTQPQQGSGRSRINPFQPGYCRADGETAATIGDGLKLPLDPQAPLARCRTWTDVQVMEMA